MKKNRVFSKKVISTFLAVLLVCGMFFWGMTKSMDDPGFWVIMFSEATMIVILHLIISEVFYKAPDRKTNEQPTTPSETEDSLKPTPDPFPVEDDNPTAEIVPAGDSPASHYDCGHNFATRYSLHLYGEVIEPTDEALNDYSMCPKCRLKEIMPGVIRCGLCGKSIWPHEQVARCEDRPGLKVGKVYCGDMVVICLRPGCAPAGMMMGTWDGEMVVPLKTMHVYMVVHGRDC